jgi:hypothetical protein
VICKGRPEEEEREDKEKDQHRGTEDTELHRGKIIGMEKAKEEKQTNSEKTL